MEDSLTSEIEYLYATTLLTAGQTIHPGEGNPLKTQQRLTGKVAVVTGASQGLGQHLALELASEGAHVVLAARNPQRLEAVAEQIRRAGGSAEAVPTDLSDEKQCEHMISRTLEQFGGIDILTLNAGFATYGALNELQSFSPIRDSMAINFFGAAYPTYLAISHLIERRGLIAYVTSGAGHLPMAGYLGYTTSKHALNGFFEALRLEMIPHGVDVLTINPGDMFSDDGAGRTVFGPDGSEHKVDLSVKRDNDIPRVPASEVARKCLDAIVERRRGIDLSPAIQKVATILRAVAPAKIDARIYHRAVQMRSAFTPAESDVPNHGDQHR
ncbi:SDR family oxidoreductase [soil metagenome]